MTTQLCPFLPPSFAHFFFYFLQGLFPLEVFLTHRAGQAHSEENTFFNQPTCMDTREVPVYKVSLRSKPSPPARPGL